MVTRANALSQVPQYDPLPDTIAKALRGRPPSYKPEYCQLVMDWRAKGYSFGGFAGSIGVARGTINEWMNRYPEFNEACSRAQSASQWWWETKAIEVATTGGQGSQGTMVMFGLINSGREDWKNKQEIEISGQITLASVVEASLKQIEAKVIDNDPAPAPKLTVDDLF